MCGWAEYIYFVSGTGWVSVELHLYLRNLFKYKADYIFFSKRAQLA
jgi:hypothetical protein